MAFILNDRVKVTSTTQGTGVFALVSATAGFETFATGIGGSNTTYYAIAHQVQQSLKLVLEHWILMVTHLLELILLIVLIVMRL